MIRRGPTQPEDHRAVVVGGQPQKLLQAAHTLVGNQVLLIGRQGVRRPERVVLKEQQAVGVKGYITQQLILLLNIKKNKTIYVNKHFFKYLRCSKKNIHAVGDTVSQLLSIKAPVQMIFHFISLEKIDIILEEWTKNEKTGPVCQIYTRIQMCLLNVACKEAALSFQLSPFSSSECPRLLLP